MRVGILNGATYPNGQSVAAVAAKNEYGWGRNPRRPFMHRTLKNNQRKWVKGIAYNIKSSRFTQGGVRRAYELAGSVAVEDMVQTIKDWSPNDPRPNSPKTIARKRARGKSSKKLKALNPHIVLIDTGTMIQSISSEAKT